MAEDTQKPWGDVPASSLRTDGPTMEEWMKAGYAASGYPPKGYAPKASLQIMNKDEFTAQGKDESEYNLYLAAQEHLKNSVLPQLNAALAAEAQAKLDADAAAERAAQEHADETVVQPEGISHVDLLRASMTIDARLRGEEPRDPGAEKGDNLSPTFHQPTPEGFQKQPAVKWEPGK